MKLLMILIFLVVDSFGQEIISLRDTPCYSYKHIIVPSELDLVQATLGKKLIIKKDVDIIHTEKEVLYFYNKILFRIEIKNFKLPCSFDEHGFYIDDDIIVYYDIDMNRTSITSWSMWENLIKGK